MGGGGGRKVMEKVVELLEMVEVMEGWRFIEILEENGGGCNSVGEVRRWYTHVIEIMEEEEVVKVLEMFLVLKMVVIVEGLRERVGVVQRW